MQKNRERYYLFDFDSTFIKSEGMDELATLSLADHPNKKSLLCEIKNLTQLGMEGEMPFDQSLAKRVKLLHANKNHIKKLNKILKKDISLSIIRNKKFFKEHKDHIYIISGGFKELIVPVVKQFGITSHHIFANTFTFDTYGNITGIDTTNPLSQNNGKAQVVKTLQLKKDFYMIGDGYTDYELKRLGLAKKFIAFTENISRDIVTKEADQIAPNFDEFLFINKLPQSISYPKNRISVLIIGRHPKKEIQYVENEGYRITVAPGNITPQKLQTAIKKISIIFCTDTKILTQEVLQNADRLLAIGLLQTNSKSYDIATKKGVAVFADYETTKKIIRYINTGNTNKSLSLPNLQLAQHKNVHRLLHIHKNIPGILAQINTILAHHKSNILGQYLKTNKQVGYVIIDIDKEYDKTLLADLKKIPETIRFRVLY